MSLRKLWLGLSLALAVQSIHVGAQVLDDADGATTANPGATVTAGLDGVSVHSSDNNFVLRMGVDIQLDNRTFSGASALVLPNQTVIRRARPTVSGTVYKYVDFYVRPDFGLGTTVLYEAYMQLNYFSRANVRVGKFKPPVGLERLQSDDDTSFVERGFPTLLVPSRDIGYQISGDVV